jgi:hypothetical protein
MCVRVRVSKPYQLVQTMIALLVFRGVGDGDCERHYLDENEGMDRNPSPGPFSGSSCLAGMGPEQRCEELRSGGFVTRFREVRAERGGGRAASLVLVVQSGRSQCGMIGAEDIGRPFGSSEDPASPGTKVQ